MKGTSSNNTSAISIAGKNGISVTADNGGKIEISGHEKPPILNTDNNKNSPDGNLVPKPDSISTNLYLRADGVWYTPTNTQVKLNGKVKDNSHTNTVASNGSGNAAEAVVQSISAGTGITLECDKNTGALTIIGPESGQNVISGTGLRYVDDGTDRVISLKAATADELGGVKVGSLGTGAIGDIQDGDSSQTIYAPPASGKYYPIETVASGDHSGHAVVKIPDVPSLFYEEDTNDKFSFAVEEYKVAYIMGQPTFAFTGEIRGDNFNNSLAAYNAREDIQLAGATINDDSIDILTTKDFIGLAITCPSNIRYAQLDLPLSLPQMPTVTMLAPVEGKKVGNNQVLSIRESNPAAGFTPGTSSHAYLKLTTKKVYDDQGNTTEESHTYTATIIITYKNGSYSVTKAF